MWKGEDWLGMGLDGLCSVWLSAGTRVLCRPKRETCDRGCSLESTGRPFYLRRAIERETGSRAFQQRTKKICLWGKGTFLKQGWIKSFSLSAFLFFFLYHSLLSYLLSFTVCLCLCVLSNSMNLFLMLQYLLSYSNSLRLEEMTWVWWTCLCVCPVLCNVDTVFLLLFLFFCPVSFCAITLTLHFMLPVAWDSSVKSSNLNAKEIGLWCVTNAQPVPGLMFLKFELIFMEGPIEFWALQTLWIFAMSNGHLNGNPKVYVPWIKKKPAFDWPKYMVAPIRKKGVGSWFGLGPSSQELFLYGQ